MNKYFLVNKNNKLVKSISDNVIDFNIDKFDLIEQDITEQQFYDMTHGVKRPVYKDGSIIEENFNPINEDEEEEKKQKEKEKQDLKKEIEDSTDIDDLKNIIKKLI